MTRLFGRTTVCGLCLVCLAACKDAPQQSGGAQYKTLTLSPTDRTLTREYTAVVEGRQSVEIRPQVSGTITEVCIDEGAKVGKGQPLFIIDQVPYQAALETAVATARMTANSKQTLFDNKVVSAFDLQTAKNSLLEAEAALAQGPRRLWHRPRRRKRAPIVESGLKAGDVIVAEGAGLLQEGTPIP